MRTNATTAVAASGAGSRPRRTAEITPSVPSEPTIRLLRSYPATSLRAQPPSATSSPGASATSSPATHAPVTPYFSACAPPAFVATLPPICDCSDAPGSGANISPFSRARRCTWRVLTPASASIRHSAGSSARTVRSRSSEHTTPPSVATAPPVKPVPPPRATIGTSLE